MPQIYHCIGLLLLALFLSHCQSEDPNYLKVFKKLNQNLESLEINYQSHREWNFRHNPQLEPSLGQETAHNLYQETSKALYYIDSLIYLTSNTTLYPDLSKTLSSHPDSTHLLEKSEARLRVYKTYIENNFSRIDCLPLYYLLNQSDYQITKIDSLIQNASNSRSALLATFNCLKLNLLIFEHALSSRLSSSVNQALTCPSRPQLQVILPHDSLIQGQSYLADIFLGLDAQHRNHPNLQAQMYLRLPQSIEKILGNEITFLPKERGTQMWELELSYYDIKNGKDSSFIIQTPFFVQ